MQIKKMDPMENKQINSNSYVQPTVKHHLQNGIIPPNMASTDDDNGIPPVPALPPIGGFDSQWYEDEAPRFFNGQNSPPGAVVGHKDNPGQ